MNDKTMILAIVGATASGKSKLAQRVADATGASLISVDSRKIYHGMDIGTAKPSREAQARYRYGMIDCAEPDQAFSAGKYAQQAREIAAERLAQDEKVILVGGSGFYLEAFVHGLPDLPEIDPEVRAAVLADAEKRGWGALHADLVNVDPEWAVAIEPTDKTRLLRATETFKQTGKPLSQWMREAEKQAAPWRVDIVELERDRAELHERIAARTDRMLAAGLIDETETLLQKGYRADSPGLATVGYQEAISHLMGKTSLDEARDQIAFHTRQYAKRQLTWFRHRSSIRKISPEETDIQSLITIFAY